jgi:hypothetical protein
MTDAALPQELLQKCMSVVEAVHRQAISPSGLPKKMATRRNAVAATLLPEAATVVRAAASTFKIRVLLWVLLASTLVCSVFITKWLLVLAAVCVVGDRLLARKERQFWMAAAATLLAADLLAADFAGWGSAYPPARSRALEALGGSTTEIDAEWLEYYLPPAANLRAEMARVLAPGRRT